MFTALRIHIHDYKERWFNPLKRKDNDRLTGRAPHYKPKYITGKARPNSRSKCAIRGRQEGVGLRIAVASNFGMF